MFIGALSGSLVALGLIATAAGVHTTFYAFALILLPTLAGVGLATFNRTLQSGVEDLAYAIRIARLRGYYFQHAPELVDHLFSVPPEERLRLQGIGGGRWQKFVTIAAMVGLVTAVLAGSAAGLLAAIVFNRLLLPALIPALIAGLSIAAVVFAALIRFQVSTWKRAAALMLDEE